MEKRISIPNEVLSLLEIGRTTLIVLLVSVFTLRFIFKISLPTEIFLILSASFLIVFIVTAFGVRRWSIRTTENLVFLFLGLLSLLMTLAIFFIGEIRWLTGIFYAFLVMTGGLILPRRKASTITMISAFGYIFLIFAGWIDIAPSATQVNISEDPTLNFVIVVVMVCMLYLINYLTNTFSVVAREMYKSIEETKSMESRMKELEDVNADMKFRLKEAKDDLKFTQEKVRELRKEMEILKEKGV